MLSTTCFAASAENDDSKKNPAAITECAATDTGKTEEEQLPYEVDVDEDGNFTFTFGDWEWSTADMKTDGTDAAGQQQGQKLSEPSLRLRHGI